MRVETHLTILPAMLVALTLVAGCVSIKTNSDYDPEHDFSGYKDFSWIPGPQGQTGDLRIDNQLLDRRIRVAIDRELQSRGYTKVERAQADFQVGYHLSVDTKLDVHTVNDYYGYGHGWGGYSTGRTYVREYDVGMLLIDVVDTAGNRLVWRGSGSRRVSSQSTPEESEKEVQAAVAAVLKAFPPGAEEKE